MAAAGLVAGVVPNDRRSWLIRTVNHDALHGSKGEDNKEKQRDQRAKEKHEGDGVNEVQPGGTRRFPNLDPVDRGRAGGFRVVGNGPMDRPRPLAPIQELGRQ